MLDKMFGVSPPLKGEALDSKLAHGKDSRETSKSDYKKDFEKALEKKLNQKKEDSVSKKEEARETEGLRADKKEKKSLGGIKKKVTEDDDKMISNVMASNESKVEIPDSKIENLAEIEVDIPENSKANAETEANAVSGAQLQQLQLGLIPNQIEMPKSVSAEAPTELKQLDVQSMQAIAEASSLKTIEEGLAAANLTSPINRAQEQSGPQIQSQAQLQAQLQTQLQDKAQIKALDLEAELSADVGFRADQSIQQTSQDLLQKMKAFEVDKNLASNKPQSFEQNVLSRLQNEQMQNVKQLSEKNLSDKNQSDSGQENSGGLKDLKSDLLDAKQLHLSAGQTHTEFKTQLGASVAAQSQSLAGKLEENREANISEIMKQAQYLATKGGGEVSVKMSPEGLGDLHLKVMFQDGKLNIEMQTQNKDIKKLVEDSLSELKSGLAAHRLSLEHVKVDTVNATNADNNTQFQSNLKHGNGGSQEQARELWRDFQGNMNNQSGKRSSYTDSLIQPNVSSRSASANATAVASAIRTYGGTKGATVNRVA